ncbi:MAG: response regulator, partial [Thermoplasmata archaeon]|nr:response regulator [Thermoplasmata archaeon]
MAPAVGPRPVHVLLVEDQPGDAKLVELALRAEPPGRFRLTRASAIAEAVDLLAAGDVDVVLTDLGLPDSEGASGVARLHRAGPGVPIVVLSGAEDPDRVRASLGAGAVDYEVKRVFPRGYLGPLLERAIVRHRLLVRLADPAMAPGVPSPEWEAVREPALVLLAGAPVLWTAPVRPFLDLTDPARPKLPDRMVRAMATTPPKTDDSTDPGATVDVGQVRLRTPGGGGVTVRFTAHTTSVGAERRSVVRMGVAGLPSETPSAVEGSASALPDRPTAPPPLDPASWARLRELAEGSDRFLPELVATFVPYGFGLVGDLRAAAAAGDSRRLELVAHDLKSTGAQVGAMGLAELCRR